MRALEAEQRAAKAASDTGSLRTAHGPRSARSPHRPSTRRAPPSPAAPSCAVGDRLLPPRRRPRGARGPARVRNGSEPRRASNSRARLRRNSSDQRTNRGGDEQLPRRGTRRGSQAQPTTSQDRSHVPVEAAPSPAGTCPQLNIAGTIALPKHAHRIDDRRIGLDRHDRANQPNELDPALELDALRIKSTTPHEPVANRTPLELELRYPIQSGPPFACHWSRQLQLPIARTHRTSTGR